MITHMCISWEVDAVTVAPKTVGVVLGHGRKGVSTDDVAPKWVLMGFAHITNNQVRVLPDLTTLVGFHVTVKEFDKG